MSEVFRRLAGSQNPSSENNPYLKDSFPGPDSLYRLKTAVNTIYAEARKKPITFPCDALCLYAHVITLTPESNDIADFQLDYALGRTVKIIEVVAHIPTLDQLYTIPEITTLEDMSDLDLWNLMLHASGDRIFRAQLHGEEGKIGSIPSPGDSIRVDFRDRVGRQAPVYIGKKRRGIGLIPSSPSINSTEASDLFAEGGEPTTMAAYETEQSLEQQEIVDDKLEEYVEAYASETGMSKDVARGYLENTLGISK